MYQYRQGGEGEAMFLKMLLRGFAALGLLGVILWFAVPEVRESVIGFDWPAMADAIMRQFGF